MKGLPLNNIDTELCNPQAADKIRAEQNNERKARGSSGDLPTGTQIQEVQAHTPAETRPSSHIMNQ